MVSKKAKKMKLPNRQFAIRPAQNSENRYWRDVFNKLHQTPTQGSVRKLLSMVTGVRE